MSVTRHAPDPTHTYEVLCGRITSPEGVPNENRLATVGEPINCPQCRLIINMARKCIVPNSYVLARAP